MRLFKLLIICMLVSCVSNISPSWAEESKISEAESQAIEAALLWLALVDQGLYDQSWDATHQKFKDLVPKEEWLGQIGAVRTPLGAVKARELVDKGYFSKIPDNPGMELMVIQFKSGFENKEYAIETVSPVRINGGPWQVSGYYIADSIDVKVQ